MFVTSNITQEFNEALQYINNYTVDTPSLFITSTDHVSDLLNDSVSSKNITIISKKELHQNYKSSYALENNRVVFSEKIVAKKLYSVKLSFRSGEFTIYYTSELLEDKKDAYQYSKMITSLEVDLYTRNISISNDTLMNHIVTKHDLYVTYSNQPIKLSELFIKLSKSTKLNKTVISFKKLFSMQSVYKKDLLQELSNEDESIF
ncbi:MAG: hypothetical protein GQ570_13345 [Helicobacteraceae bacterium]|nr:hypothetical protein [Helicobacteraceae bacterium]